MEKPVKANYQNETAYKADLIKYINERSAAFKDVNEPKIVEEEHPDVGLGERWKSLNLGKDTRAIVETAQRDHPNVHVVEHNGRVLLRDKSDPVGSDWKVFDPDKDFFSLETLKDTGDIGNEVGAGAIELLGGVLGGIGGTALSTLTGGTAAAPLAIGGAMTGAGAAGAGFEAGRQTLGKWMGMKQDVSGTDAAIAGAVAAPAQLVGGLGFGGKQAMKKGLGKIGAKVLQGGLLYGPAKWGAKKTAFFGKMIYDGVTETFPRAVAEILTGIKARTWNDYLNNPEIIKMIDKLGVAGYSDQEIKGLFKIVQASHEAAGRGYDELAKSGKTVELGDVKKVFEEHKKKLLKMEASKTIDKPHAKQLDKLSEMIDDIFTGPKYDAPMPYPEAKKIADGEIEVATSMVKAKDAGKVKAPTKAETDANIKASADKALQSHPEAQMKLNNLQKQSAENLIQVDQQAKIAAERQKMFPASGLPTQNTSRDLTKSADIDSLYQMRDTLDKFSNWKKRTPDTPLDDKLTSLAKGGKMTLTDSASGQLKGKGPRYGELVNMSKKAREMNKVIDSKFQNTGKNLEQTPNFNVKGAKYLKSAGKGDEAKIGELVDIDSVYSTGLGKSARMIGAHDTLRNAKVLPKGKTVVSSGAIGGGVGAGVGYLANDRQGAYTGSKWGTGLGLAAGSLAGSPTVWKALLKTAATPKKMASAVSGKANVIAQKTGMTVKNAKALVLRELLKETGKGMIKGPNSHLASQESMIKKLMEEK